MLIPVPGAAFPLHLNIFYQSMVHHCCVVTSNIALITQNREMGGICFMFEISYLIKEGKGSGFFTVLESFSQ